MSDPTLLNFIIAATCAFLLGVSKSGIKGIASLIVTGLALVYGAKNSTGILMPLLLVGDVFAITYYKRHVQKEYIIKLLPWMIVGVLLGVVGGKYITEDLFKYGMAAIILFSVGLMYYWENKKDKSVPSHWSFASSMGLLAGFTTMIGNLAGAFSNIYFLAMRLPKNNFIGTAAWLFFLINSFKVPFHIWSWETINSESILISIQLVPFVIVGLIAGVFLVKKIENDNYRKLILLFTAIGGIAILFN
ncbi:sulfite exporter TauE/SafE family protein [Flavobacteriaceae bacterium]|nr:sulfite exporter TauE/SafE family protein [Flavobacteriaceae bacterium]MDA8948933.1 sulfite exporter TauE/SafE family protein [Flavobacteriaceae bacterium]MDA9015232.1 sulfite exporter TauE/SafE family protein [Flavobacteriaceae bacterium]MDA9572026.1 sulfite exporter TauE/SafE family protein [Flavobacteriaceae bacterium]MDB3862137.1 sulfite exporter TauE/SafE family protein [Flavobacteriaceae bacterium]